MAISKLLQQAEPLHSIADELGSWIGYVKEPGIRNNCGILNALEICTLDPKEFQKEKPHARDYFKQTDTQHIQIVGTDEAHASYYARVRPGTEESGWHVISFAGEWLAKAVDGALKQLDELFDDSWSVRMVEVPAYFITGLTAERDDDIRVRIVRAGPGIQLDTDKIYTIPELQAAMATLAPIRGVDIDN